jgi:hypothetical protein
VIGRLPGWRKARVTDPAFVRSDAAKRLIRYPRAWSVGEPGARTAEPGLHGPSRRGVWLSHRLSMPRRSGT